MRNVTAIKGRQIKQLFSDDPQHIEQFAQTYDQLGFDIYDCVAELVDDAAARRLDTVKLLSFLHVDIDLRSLATSRDEVLAKLKTLPLPLEIRDSGGGFHVIVYLKEPVEAGTPEFERANALRKQLTHLLAGDPAPDHAAALLRRPGTRNHKYDPLPTCQVVHDAR